ncbi:S-formylglutathione hydrolase [Pseudidiomarina tainanensis]|jgi:S-formylglutathione hydrolase|uniref:S-formylglutathione hydrolase n=2 Tax=Pseudidiomarina TaxID=2800384 RepID=A0A1I6G5Y7_9GAMM|nr:MULTISPECIES: S-formylglutathione hydrolase [Pseudidiomarina]RZQ57109.1 S-formylglutathione hydrolase [Pseudidiomarina tainanensis]SFR37616.1 S-formylglutathione hydrolase [Pseudidiomarina maritima]
MINKVSETKAFGGRQIRFEHQSTTLNCTMQFSVYLPPQAEHQSVPALYWLSGLTCTDENFSSKAGAQRIAAELGIALIIPDTSPRGDDVPDDSEQAYDFGLGAGFYVNATQQPWAKHYHMYDYVVTELRELVEQHLPLNHNRSISGHSMGGHGALVMALRNQNLYASVSAFAPICHPTACPWGHKAFSGYLGDDRSEWLEYDATELLLKLKSAPPMLVSQGEADNFLAEQLRPDDLDAAIQKTGITAQIERHQGYDHSYYFIASFIEQHLRFHAQHLR